MSHPDDAEAIFGTGLNCCQAILSAFAEEYGLTVDDARRLGSGFGGGMGGMGLTCGAVTGAFMVIGLKHPRLDRASGAKSIQLVQEFSRRFTAARGSIGCRELIGYDISTPQGNQAAREAGVFKSICPVAVKTAAEILDELLGT